MKEVLTALGMLAAVVVVLILAYWSTKLISRLSLSGWKRPGGYKRQLQVLEQLSVGKTQQLLVVRAGERYFLIGFSDCDVSMLMEFTKEEAACWQPGGTVSGDEAQLPSFREALLAELKKRKK